MMELKDFIKCISDNFYVDVVEGEVVLLSSYENVSDE